MSKRLLAIGLITTIMMAIAIFIVNTETNAVTRCLAGQINVGGQCFDKASFFAGSVIANLFEDNPGPLNKNPTLDVHVEATSGAVICKNPGSGNQSPGIQLAPVIKTLLFAIPDAVPIQKGNMLPGGIAQVNGQTAELSETQQSELVEFCPNANWTTTGTNYLMCVGTVFVTFKNDLTTRTDTWTCRLDNCLSTQWDADFNFLGNPRYTCELQPPQ